MFFTVSGGRAQCVRSRRELHARLILSILAKILEVILKSFQIKLLEYKKINR